MHKQMRNFAERQDNMKLKTANLRIRLYLVTVIILVAGLGGSLLIYMAAVNDADSVLGYEMSDGNVYPINPEDSKAFTHDMELYGGKANVLANELTNWFAGLWHGKSLAFTTAVITMLVSVVIFFIANHLSSDLEPDIRDEDNRTKED